MSLQFEICIRPDRAPVQYSFQAVDGLCTVDDPDSNQYRLEDVEWISYDDDRLVVSGTLSGKQVPPDTKAVCKLALFPESIDAFRHEATLYHTKLQELQGSCIPRYYGFYTGVIHGRPAACLLLEHCGVTPYDWYAIPMPLR